MIHDFKGKVLRGIKKPPRIIFLRIISIFKSFIEKYASVWREKNFCFAHLYENYEVRNIDSLWKSLQKTTLFPSDYSSDCFVQDNNIVNNADLAIKRKFSLLGLGEMELPDSNAWNKDYKTGMVWENYYSKSIEYNNPGRPSDVKIPWEISRMQWFVSVGQAYAITGDEKYADFSKNIIKDWVRENPYAWSVNWACTMEVAIRIIVWVWFFHIFSKSDAWNNDTSFKKHFIKSLFLHGDFTMRHLEYSDINGNHYTADAAGLVFAGLFFDGNKSANKWKKTGWKILCDELPKQVYADGVDFEMSTAYHRLVLELFFFPALYRERFGLDVPKDYKKCVITMARFVAAYSRPDGTTPLWGDADDARALPFGGQDINDHRYLPGLIGCAWSVPDLIEQFSGPRDEIDWWLGSEVASKLPVRNKRGAFLSSRSFQDGGFYIMQNGVDHVFIDCGPVGLGGRGGHGHNDCLSFEAMLDGEHLITDCGAYLYTASYEWRNKFRSTAYHNTPCIDDEEQNRFIRPDYLWNLHYDAVPNVKSWETSDAMDVFVGSHIGYKRLQSPVTPVRSIALEHKCHRLLIHDTFEGNGNHKVSIPLHLALGVKVDFIDEHNLTVEKNGCLFRLNWEGNEGWKLIIGKGWVSPSYGVKKRCVRLVFERDGPLSSLSVSLMPEECVPLDINEWQLGVLRGIDR